MTTLRECAKNFESDSPNSSITDSYVQEVGEVSATIVDGMDDKSLSAAVALVQSTAISMCLADGDLSGKDMKFLMSGAFNKIAAIIFQMSLGIAATEELR